MLEVQHLTHSYGHRAVLDDLSLVVRPGEVTALLGLNGAGKTTLLRDMLCLAQPDCGAVFVDGLCLLHKGTFPQQPDSVTVYCTADGGRSTGSQRSTAARRSWQQPDSAFLSARARARLLSYVPQSPAGDFAYSCEAFVALGVTAYIGLFSHPGADDLARARQILTDLHCAHLIGRPLRQLSGGERRMVYLARSIQQDARYLLLDEPVASLDFVRQHEFLRALQAYVHGERRPGCLLSIHDPQMAYLYADRMLFLGGGRLVADLRRDAEGGGFAAEAGMLTLEEAVRAVYGEKIEAKVAADGIMLRYRE